MILNVAIKRFEHFDNIDSNIDAKQNIDFDVAKKINETNETNKTNETNETDEQMIVDFFSILHVDFDVKSRKFELIFDF